MVLITGPLASGKRTYATQLGYARSQMAACKPDRPIPTGDVLFDVQALVSGGEDAAALERLADELAAKPVVIATEVGAGIVPADAAERAWRESAGRLACLLAARADTVVRLCCGIPHVLEQPPAQQEP